MTIELKQVTSSDGGSKAGALAALTRVGLPVPAGFVLPFEAYRDAVLQLRTELMTDAPEAIQLALKARALPNPLLHAVAIGLQTLGDAPVAVRSSASDEDADAASAAGQFDSVLGVRGVDDVAAAIRTCWVSLFSSRIVAYRSHSDENEARGQPAMAVLVQRMVDASVSGVLFTPTSPDGATRIEASWGLGASIVGGTVTPDAYSVAADGTISRTIADKRARIDRHDTGVLTSDVAPSLRGETTIHDETATRLARLGHDVAAVLGGPQDIEWAIDGDAVWILQARPITAPLPHSPIAAAMPAPSHPLASRRRATLTGTPGSHGTATGTARIVRGPADFRRVQAGDILVCPYTDPAWTPLLSVVAGVITETGGVLSHAAIVAREHRIPAVLGIRDATSTIPDGIEIIIDGSAGTMTGVVRSSKEN